MSAPLSPNPLRFVQGNAVQHETNEWTRNEWICRPGLVAAEKLLTVRAEMAPGHCHPFHCHPHREEVIYIVKGRGEQWVEGECRILGVGEAAHIPPGVPHALYNPHDEPLVFLAILSPAKLPEELAAQVDPVDLSTEEPWVSIRAGRPPCKTLASS